MTLIWFLLAINFLALCYLAWCVDHELETLNTKMDGKVKVLQNRVAHQEKKLYEHRTQFGKHLQLQNERDNFERGKK